MALKMGELLPCPFCGDFAIATKDESDMWLVLCNRCGASSPIFETREAAIGFWNTRLPLSEVFSKYQHLDHLLTDKQWLPDNFQGRMLYDFWQAIRLSAQPNPQHA